MAFQKLYGKAATVCVHTPGRVNLIGEHTDYNDGFVLPTVIPQTTTIELAPRQDQTVQVASKTMTATGADKDVHTYTLGQEVNKGGWTIYVQGVTQILASAGSKLRGFDVLIDSTVPTGAGLSSSAALTVGLIKALREAFHLDLADTRIAQLARRVENEFVGARVGIMDQMAVALAKAGQAMFLDTRSLEFQLIDLPSSLGLIVINSGVSHSNIGGGYGERRASCEEAASQLGVDALRDIGVEGLGRLDPLPPLLHKRARHVITENDRVLHAVAALRARDLTGLGALFAASHASMRDDYEISIPEIDALVAIATADKDVYGARMTGGGFGGSVVIAAKSEGVAATAERIAARYKAQVGKTPTVVVPPPTHG